MHVIEMFDRSAKNNPDRLALSGVGGDFTYHEVQSFSYRIARAMVREGLDQSARFAFLSPNHSVAMICMLGAMRAKGVWCNVNLRDTPDQIIDVLKRGGIELIFYHSIISGLIPAMKKHVSTLKAIICIDKADENGTYLEEWVQAESATRPDIIYLDNEIGVQGITGGTTGLPKLVVHSNLWWTWCMVGFSTSLYFKKPPIYLAVAPITHAGGVIALFTLTQGGTAVMMQPDLDAILEAIPKRKISLMFLPPTLTYMLLAHQRVREYDYSSLEYIISAAAPIAPDKLMAAMEVFGPVIAQMLGQTESGFPLTYISPSEYQEAIADISKRHRLGSCGKQTMVISRLEIVDEKDNILSTKEKGEIVFRGPAIMRAYLNDPDATTEIQKNGWQHSGDIGYIDEEGYLYIVDRKRDMVVSGGFNIFPYEIEQVLCGHPAVRECAVVGVPDDKWGEAVKAVVVLNPGQKATEKELQDLCNDKVGSMKTPKTIDFVDDLPRNSSGKILKRVLREKYWEGHDRRVG
jgi:fatty-acyl-CoA synthase